MSFSWRKSIAFAAFLTLGSLLVTEVATRMIDVVNAGIPHSTSANILAMLRAEILDYDPDVVTFYEVFNDAGVVMDENRIEATARWAHAHLATYVALKRVLETVGGPILHSRW